LSLEEKKLLEKTWSEWLAKIETDLTIMLESRYYFRELVRVLNANPRLDSNRFMVWVWKNYLLIAAVAARRLMDRHKKCASLYHLLTGIKAHPEVLSRARYASLFKDTGLEKDFHYINSCFDKLVGAGRDYPDPTRVERYLNLLLKSAAPIKDFVDMRVAHLDRRELATLPKVKDLDRFIYLAKRVTERLYAIFSAGSIELQPSVLIPWKWIFKEPWVSDGDPSEV
jgi:hypothetical protein